MTLKFNEFELNLDAAELRFCGEQIEIEPRVFDLIAFLATNAGRAVTKDEIIDAVWQGRLVSDSAISTQIGAARRALGDDGAAQKIIKTLHGRGFRFEAQPIHMLPGQHEAVTHDEKVVTSEGLPQLPDKPSIAVLPFENISGDSEQEYFADGMAEEIITALSHIDLLFVIARNSSFTYKGCPVDIRQVGRELGVRYVLEGSVRKAGNRVRIACQLIEAESGHHLWAERFDGTLENIFDLQDQIAESVAGILEPTLRATEIERSRCKRPENLAAYDYQLRAYSFAFSLSPEDNQQAIELLDKAIALDPATAIAPALKAWCMAVRSRYGWEETSTLEYRAEAVALARTAIKADNKNASTLATAGFVLVVMGKEHRSGIAILRRALEINKNSAFVCMLAGWVHFFNGDYDEGIALLRRALRLSPVDPLKYHILAGIAHGNLFTRRPEIAYEYALRSVSEYDSWAGGWRLMASACGHLGRLEEAQTALRKLEATVSMVTISKLRDWLPHRNKESLEYFLDGLRKAGLPE